MIDIAELLKDAPYGTELWCTLYGEVYFTSIDPSSYYPIKLRLKNSNTKVKLDKYGRYYDNFEQGECILFPSKDCRTWEEWKLPVEPKFKVGDWIVRGEGFVYEPSLITEIRDYYICELINGERVTYTLNDVHKNFHLWTIEDAKDGDILMSDKGNPFIFCEDRIHAGYHNIIAYCGITTIGSFCESSRKECWTYGTSLKPATKEQRDLLFAKMREAGYEWDADKKELRKIQPHYDIANLHEGMPVLVRDYDNTQWRYVQFSHCVGKDNPIMFNACGNTWEQCIPFNDDTKHLLGTTDMPSEEYINW